MGGASGGGESGVFLGGGGPPPPPPHGQIIGCRVAISLDPTSEKTGSMNFVGVLLLYFSIGRVSGNGSRFSLSLSLFYGTWNPRVRVKV